MKKNVLQDGGDGNNPTPPKLVFTWYDKSPVIRMAKGRRAKDGSWVWKSRSAVEAPGLVESFAFWSDELDNGEDE